MNLTVEAMKTVALVLVRFKEADDYPKPYVSNIVGKLIPQVLAYVKDPRFQVSHKHFSTFTYQIRSAVLISS